MICKVSILDAICEYTKNDKIIVYSGVDPDRYCLLHFYYYSDVAKYCCKFSAFALTNDSDFLLYKIPGVIFLNEIVLEFQTECNYLFCIRD